MMETVIVPTPGTLNCAMNNDLQVVHGHACDCSWLMLQATAAEHQHLASEKKQREGGTHRRIQLKMESPEV